MNNDIKLAIENKMNCKITEYSHTGKGASANVYKVKLNKSPYCIAVKTNDIPKLIFDEYNNIKFISEKISCKLPKIYFVDNINGKGILAMEFINGVSPNNKTLLLKRNKSKLANEIVDNLIKIHSVHNDKFGPINNAVYDSWYEYYKQFAKEILDFTNSSNVSETVKYAVNTAYNKLDKIIGNDKSLPTLTHGDYWAPNFIIDKQNMNLNGIIDPFNVLWAEPEYELFTLTVGYGKKLHLYELYKSKVKTTNNCDIKVELYALFNELLWYKILEKIDNSYLIYRSKKLIKMMKLL